MQQCLISCAHRESTKTPMKLFPKKRLQILAIAGLLLAASASSFASGTIAYTQDDLMMGFQAPNSSLSSTTGNYLVDLGSATLFAAAAAAHPGTTYTVGISGSSGIGNIFTSTGLNTDLSSSGVFNNASWNADPNALWGIVASPGSTSSFTGNGITDASKTVYATMAETTSGTPPTTSASAWGLSNTNLSTASGNIGNSSSLGNGTGTAGSGGLNGATATANNPFGTVQTNNNLHSWGTYQPGGSIGTNSTSFNVFNPSVEGATNQVLDLYKNTTGVNSAFLGSFALSSAGVLTFTTPGAAPEPGRAVLLSLGIAAALLRRRRKSVNA
jgi:hypothetical protein